MEVRLEGCSENPKELPPCVANQCLKDMYFSPLDLKIILVLCTRSWLQMKLSRGSLSLHRQVKLVG